MNIFVLDLDPQLAAQYHNDKHVVKMILESAQIMSTVVRESGIDAGYRPTHKNHPCTLWAGKSLNNYYWLKELAGYLVEEWRYRFGHPIYKEHASAKVIRTLPEPSIDDIGLTPFAQAMPLDCRVDEQRLNAAVDAYRCYYNYHKRHISTWKVRGVPFWYQEYYADVIVNGELK